MIKDGAIPGVLVGVLTTRGAEVLAIVMAAGAEGSHIENPFP